ncbi:MAG: CHASE sensor domain-containing protein, partial [Chitinivibrionales bacterium]
MRFLKGISIRKKITMLIVFACVLSLFVTIGALMVFELSTYRQRALSDARTQAAILATNLHAPLTFEHHQAADHVLQSLQLNPSVFAAGVMKPDSQYLAIYIRGSADSTLLPRSPTLGYRFSNGYLILTRRVVYQQKVAGYLSIQYTLERLTDRFPGYGIAVLALLTALILVGIVLHSGFTNLISRRLDTLAQTARQISDKKDFSIRAPQNDHDELGVFTQTLNTMLDTIEQQDEAIRRSEERLRLAMEASRIGIWQWNPENHLVTIDASFLSFSKGKKPDQTER